MAKDVIFANAPSRPKVESKSAYEPRSIREIGLFSRDEPKRIFYSKNEINLKEWIPLEVGDQLQKGDIFDYDIDRYAESDLLGTFFTGIGNYYRRKSTVTHDCRKKTAKIIDNNSHEYEWLSSTTILQEGDEFYCEDSCSWHFVQCINRPAGSILLYRRAVRKFTDKELETARKHYKVNDRPFSTYGERYYISTRTTDATR